MKTKENSTAEEGQRFATEVVNRNKNLSYGGFNEHDPQPAHSFECLVPSWWNCFGKIGRCGFVGGVSLEMGFELSEAHIIPCY